MKILEKIELGKLVGGTNQVLVTPGGTYTLPDGTKADYSSDCIDGNGGATYYGYKTDSASGWVNPCA